MRQIAKGWPAKRARRPCRGGLVDHLWTENTDLFGRGVATLTSGTADNFLAQ